LTRTAANLRVRVFAVAEAPGCERYPELRWLDIAQKWAKIIFTIANMVLRCSGACLRQLRCDTIPRPAFMASRILEIICFGHYAEGGKFQRGGVNSTDAKSRIRLVD